MLPFEDYAVWAVIGPTASGKSVFCRRMCQHSKTMFETPVDKIIYCYKQWEEEFNPLQSQVENITFTPTIPTEPQLEEAMKDSKHGLIVIDDALENLIADQEICRALATRLAHHLKMTVVFCTQSGQMPGKHGGIISKNIHNAVIMRSPQQSYLRQLGVQLGEYQLLRESYMSATGETPHTYLMVCLHPKRHPDHRYISDVFPDDSVMYVYKKPGTAL